MKTETELRELDAWIAENVMGLVERETTEGVACWPGGIQQRPVKKRFSGDMASMDVLIGGIELPRYSTDPAAALEVLKKCGERGILNGEFKLPVSIFQRGDLKWVVSENFEDEEADSIRHCIVVEADTLELATCLFCKELFTKKP